MPRTIRELIIQPNTASSTISQSTVPTAWCAG